MKSRLIQMKVTEDQEALIRSAAKSQGISVAALVRAATLAYVGVPGEGPSLAGRVRALEDQGRQLRDRIAELTRQTLALVGRAITKTPP